MFLRFFMRSNKVPGQSNCGWGSSGHLQQASCQLDRETWPWWHWLWGWGPWGQSVCRGLRSRRRWQRQQTRTRGRHRSSRWWCWGQECRGRHEWWLFRRVHICEMCTLLPGIKHCYQQGQKICWSLSLINFDKIKMSFYISFCLSICYVTFSRPLIGQKKECYIVEEVIEVDELDKGNISAASGKQYK